MKNPLDSFDREYSFLTPLLSIFPSKLGERPRNFPMAKLGNHSIIFRDNNINYKFEIRSMACPH